jgi:hypothetical protein
MSSKVSYLDCPSTSRDLMAAYGLAMLLILAVAYPSSVFGQSATPWQFRGPNPMKGITAEFFNQPFGSPFNATGRVTSLAAVCTLMGEVSCASESLFVGTAGGGVWMSTDLSSNTNPFTQITDNITPAVSLQNLPAQAIGSIAIDSSTKPVTLYVATGEGNLSSDSLYGSGVFVSSNLGVSWRQIGDNHFMEMAITKLAVVPTGTAGTPVLLAGLTSAETVNRAAVGTFVSNAQNFGLWRSADQGTSWHQMSISGCTINLNGTNAPCPVDDINVIPVSGGGYAVFATVSGLSGGTNPGIFYSVDTGLTWSSTLTLTSNSASSCSVGTPCPQTIGRISLASLPIGGIFGLPPTSGEVVAVIGDKNGQGYDSVFTLSFTGSSPGAAIWSKTSQVPFSTQNGLTIDGIGSLSATHKSQSGYDQALVINPATPTQFFFGGIGLYSSTDSGNSWSFLPTTGSGGSLHDDQHAMVFDPMNPAQLWIGDDGGLFQRTVGKSGFVEFNESIAAGQLYSVAAQPARSDAGLGGFQDNGIQSYDPADGLAWISRSGGDGSFVSYQPGNPSIAYATLESSSFQTNPQTYNQIHPLVSSDGGSSFSILTSLQSFFATTNDTTGFFPPLATVAAGNGPLLLAGNLVDYSPNGSTGWTVISGNQGAGVCQNGLTTPCAIQDIEVAPSDSNTAYTLSKSVGNIFRIFVTKNLLSSPPAWTAVSTVGLPALPPSSLTVSPFDPNTVYLGVSGFNLTGASHIFQGVWNQNTLNMTWTALQPFPSMPGTISNSGDIPVQRVLVDNLPSTNGQHLIAGTDSGLYESTDGGNTWFDGTQGIVPRVPVVDIEQNQQHEIVIGTHGRGAYRRHGTSVYFVGSTQGEKEKCSGSTCSITVTPPAHAQIGDTFVVTVLVPHRPNGDPVVENNGTIVNGWNVIGFNNYSNPNGSHSVIYTDGAGGNTTTQWLLLYRYGTNSPEPSSYSIVAPISGASEVVYGLYSYRGASSNFAEYLAYGYPFDEDGPLITAGPTNAPANMMLVELDCGSFSETSEENGKSLQISSELPSGPPLTPETSLTDNIPLYDLDGWTDNGATFYNSYLEKVNGNIISGSPTLGMHVLLPPQ